MTKNMVIFSVEREKESLVAKVGKDTSIYEVIGFLSMYLEHLKRGGGSDAVSD